MSEWISTSEKMPPEGEVVVAESAIGQRIGYRNGKKFMSFEGIGEVAYEMGHVIRWKPHEEE